MASELLNRSRPFRGGRRAAAWLPILAFLAYVVWSHLKWGLSRDTMMLETFFGAMALMIFLFMVSAVYWRSFTHLPPASGRVLAIVPCYNEGSALGHAVGRALLRPAILPPDLPGVDEGSLVPNETLD